ncbi:uncharacterized protein LOC113520808 [Galleria mellonella]|uniref:Uncharacterized protein LOC113520808 n=1 Tax=Galleria mellonella TaxID=7137 RepID=A0A6J1X6R1_GALME|nr:uncharacterized protein LOC113520808 [Galleria mellonella]
MAENNDVQALEKISTQVDETQIKITLSSQCIKAQAFLFNKLRRQSERQKEICIIISNSNLKLEAEIKQAEQEINSLIIAHEAIKSANVELIKECLLAQERKQEIDERVTEGQKKYDKLWLECKSRYESIPRVQKLIQTTNKAQLMKESIIILENEIEKLVKQIVEKKKYLLKLERLRVIEIAKFFIYEVKQIEKQIGEKSKEVVELEQDINKMLKEQECRANKVALNTLPVEVEHTVEESDNNKLKDFDANWPSLCSTNETLRLPRLQLLSADFDDLSSKLDQIKKSDIIQPNVNKRICSVTNELETTIKRLKSDETSLFYYFNKPIPTEDNMSFIYQSHESNIDNFSKKKLINILEDVKIDKNDAYKIMSKVKREKLKDVTVIGTEVSKEKDSIEEIEQIEEIDLTNTSVKTPIDGIIIPPTEFLDLTQNSQESISKKKVSFDLPESAESNNQINEDENDEVTAVDQTINSELNASHTSAESYTKLKDMILKKHNLDSSPQFVYAKNTILQTRNDDNVITSKFFQQSNTVIDVVQNENETENVNAEQVEETRENIKETDHTVIKPDAINNESNLIVTQESKLMKTDKAVTGFLFSHGTQGCPDSLDMSISTTGFEEGEDFPHCIDSNLLLSPKADDPISENAEVLSQEVPNFLSGLRKTGFSFFGNSEKQKETKNQSLTDTQNQQNNNFSFNFGEEKKNRGGLFSMFH